MTTKDVKEITYMPLVTFFIVLERPGKNRRPLVRRGLKGMQRVICPQYFVTKGGVPKDQTFVFAHFITFTCTF